MSEALIRLSGITKRYGSGEAELMALKGIDVDIAAGEFVEVHVDASLQTAERRDTKGLYRKARQGQLRNFTGIDSPYEAPTAPEIRIDTEACTPEEAADAIVTYLTANRLRT